MLPLLARCIALPLSLEPSGVESALRGRVRFGLRAGKKLRIGRRVEFVGGRNMTFGKSVTFWGNSYLNAAGPNGRIEIGDETHVDQFCVLYGQGGLKIGSRCAIASGVIVYSQTNQFSSSPESPILDQPVVYARVEIGDDVWIGARTVILPGVRIGSHAVIGAGAVVLKDIPDWAIAVGAPARVLRDRRETSGPA